MPHSFRVVPLAVLPGPNGSPAPHGPHSLLERLPHRGASFTRSSLRSSAAMRAR
jgi:hypothetical protein